MKTTSIHVNENCFDIIRLVCIFTVFFGHFLTHFQIENTILHEIAYSIRGVTVFFFLSGFFIARSLERYTTKEFLTKRAIRIFPELWVCVLLNLVIILIALGSAYGKAFDLKDIGIYLGTQMTAFQFYTGGWLRSYGVGTPNGALWTITVDLQFYIVSIFLAKWLKNKSLKVWGFLIVFFILFDILCERTKAFYPEVIYKLLQCNVVPLLWMFLIGMALYYHRDKLIPVIVKLRWVFLGVYVVWQFLVPSVVTNLFSGVRFNTVTTVLLLLLVTAVGFSFNKRLKTDYSYSFYLYHMVVMNVVIHFFLKEITSPVQLVLVFLINLVATGLLAVLSRKLIAERLTSWIEGKVLKA